MMPADSSRRPGRAGLIAGLLPPSVAAAESTGRPPGAAPGLFPAEQAALRTAGPRRRAEFAAGRSCARAALATLGVAAGPILPGPAGQPLWPAGVTGSITHCAGYQACAVARTTDVAAIGIDAEPDAALPAGLIETVATGPERVWISRHAAGRARGLLGPAALQRQGSGPQAVVPADRALAGLPGNGYRAGHHRHLHRLPARPGPGRWGPPGDPDDGPLAGPGRADRHRDRLGAGMSRASALRPGEQGRLGAMAAVILVLNGAGWGVFVFSVLPRHLHYQGLGVGLGVAITAWTLGARHAFDADHISAIDNVTRKLMSDGKRPLGTGFCFALGHSTIIVAIGAGIALAARAVFGAVVNPSSTYETLGGMVGTLLAATFLYLIAALNLVVLAGIARIFRDMRRGRYSEAELERQLQARGLMYRFFGRFMRAVNHSLADGTSSGMAFGIGFDTATEVLLLTAAVYAATSGLPFYAVLALPLLFAGGMTLVRHPGRLLHELSPTAGRSPGRSARCTTTWSSPGSRSRRPSSSAPSRSSACSPASSASAGAFWDFAASFDINKAGFTIAALFVTVWAAAIVIWRLGDIESRWQAGPPAPPD